MVRTDLNIARNDSGDRSDGRPRKDVSDCRQKFDKHCYYCDQDGHTWKYCWEMQALIKKAKRIRVLDG